MSQSLKDPSIQTLNTLMQRIHDNRALDPSESYVAKMFKKGEAKIAQKLGEEAVEMVIAATQEDRGEVINEGADLLFHYLLLLESSGVSLNDITDELANREGISGLTEKANRKES